MPALGKAVLERAQKVANAAGSSVDVLSVSSVSELASELDVEAGAVELAALENGITPCRYLRNQTAFSPDEQKRLLRSTVAQVGLGGLGGICMEMLLRLGLAEFRGADGDVAGETDLNRQLLTTTHNLGIHKAENAATRARAVNPSVKTRFSSAFLDHAAMAGHLAGATLAMDCLGGLAHRLALQKAATAENIPLVTGAMAGWTGYVAVVQPGCLGPAELFGEGSSVEEELGTQAPQVYAVASLMVAEAAKILCGQSSTLSGKMLVMDMQQQSYEIVEL